jgi:hypothetical protein
LRTKPIVEYALLHCFILNILYLLENRTKPSKCVHWMSFAISRPQTEVNVIVRYAVTLIIVDCSVHIISRVSKKYRRSSTYSGLLKFILRTQTMFQIDWALARKNIRQGLVSTYGKALEYVHRLRRDDEDIRKRSMSSKFCQLFLKPSVLTRIP